MITPEQFSFSAERKLIENIGTNSLVNAEVISFNRIAHRLSIDIGGYKKTNLSKTGKAIIMHSILESQKEDLKFLSKSTDDISVAISAISEFKKHNIKVEMLKKAINGIEDIYLKTKLEDITSIYNSYEEFIRNKFIDEEDKLSILAKQIKESSMFDNSYVYIDEFTGFTSQEYEIIKEISKKSNEVNITICMDELDGKNPIFESSRKVIKKLEKCTESKIYFVNTCEEYGYTNDEMKHLEKNIYKNTINKTDIYKANVKNVEIMLTQNPYTEVENIAKQIIKLVRDRGYRYKDIILIAKNIEEYESLVKAIFTTYNIPNFIDKKGDLSTNVFIKYILSIIDILQKGWTNDAVFTYIKTEFLEIEKKDIYILENYCKKWGIKGKKWEDEKWTFEDENTEMMNYLKEIITKGIIKLKTNLGRRKTADEITREIYKFLEENDIINKLNTKINILYNEGNIETANEYKTSYDVLIGILNEISMIFGKDNISFEKYKNLLKIGLVNSDLGKIPATIDQVLLADMVRSKPKNAKAVFVLEVNDGIYPSVNKNEGFFDDNDRESLANMSIEMAKGTLDNLYEEELNTYKILSLPDEKIFISYVASDKEGGSKRPSILIKKIRKMFPRLVEKSDIVKENIEISNDIITFKELLEQFRSKKDGKAVEQIWFDVYNWYANSEEWKYKLQMAIKGLDYNNRPDQITKHNIEALYGSTLNTSISKLEQYKKCPFSFHLKYGIKIKESDEYRISSIDTGTFMHDIIDTFFEETLQFKEMTEEEIEKKIYRIIEEKLGLTKNYIYTSSAKFVVLTNRLKRVIVKAIHYIVEQLKQSEFEILGNEVEFKAKYDNAILTGKIDRIDVGANEDGEYIRVIDYKSSTKNIELNELEAGTQIQLIAYIDSIAKKYNKEPAGVLYYNLIDPIVKSKKDLTEEEIEEKIRKSFRMRGLVLSDIKVIKMMDKKLTNGSSDSIPVTINKSGEISSAKSSIVTREEFEKLRKTVNKLINNISKEIMQGKVDIEPIYNTRTKKSACEYCEYKIICGFNSNYNKYNVI